MKQLPRPQQALEKKADDMVIVRHSGEKRLATDVDGRGPKVRMTKKQWRVLSPRDDLGLPGLFAGPPGHYGSAVTVLYQRKMYCPALYSAAVPSAEEFMGFSQIMKQLDAVVSSENELFWQQPPITVWVVTWRCLEITSIWCIKDWEFVVFLSSTRTLYSKKCRRDQLATPRAHMAMPSEPHGNA